ncbi:MAG: hypothetical protein FWC26_08230 [Fibromonadales bacterium]|nr:hypothetical protein [Fibromonadales bacterium]
MVEKNDYGTKMDDVILESLKPQVEEIKKRLASGGSLSHEDIITLTLYTQGNHINHIDMRVDALDGKFNALSEGFAGLRVDFEKLRADVRSEISEFGTKFENRLAGLEVKLENRLAGLDVKLEKFRGDSSRMTAVIGSICATSIAIATLITNIMSR